MFEKTFRIVSNSKKYLSREEIAQALLNYATQDIKEPNIFFGVMEYKDKSAALDSISLDKQP
jgi:hypothetical protein